MPINNEIELRVTKYHENSFNLISSYLEDLQINISHNDFESEAAKFKNNGNVGKKMVLYFVFAAFIGGLILNIMPCVLPVLSIKLISILKNRRYNNNIIKLSFLFTIIGIMVSFATIGLLAGLISLSGETFNWGVQFQSPVFLSLLIAIFSIYIANILGYFNFAASYRFSNFLNKKIESSTAKKRLFLSNFFSGVLAVLLATPCSAPFLGVAISFSVVQPPFYSFLMFLVMGIGFAMPYVFLILFPKPYS